ncbi:unnamed protein product [Schistocephalus solidus]|uniref:U6 snRNA phosphodiesterase 1 n=1 Tax=Schistocephalus solidus TaxID=70667 RepID=A0A183TB94_SCHSO|nr:unnamed protein product [Schistocephalus solidus]
METHCLWSLWPCLLLIDTTHSSPSASFLWSLLVKSPENRMALVDYSSSEGEEALELPLSLEQFLSDEKRFSAQQERLTSPQSNRVRSFPHVHGNWASCVFIPGLHSWILPIHSFMPFMPNSAVYKASVLSILSRLVASSLTSSLTPEDMSILFREIIDAVNPFLTECSSQFFSVEDPHLSLTKTWPILHHWIDGFARFVATVASENTRYSLVGAQICP